MKLPASSLTCLSSFNTLTRSSKENKKRFIKLLTCRPIITMDGRQSLIYIWIKNNFLDHEWRSSWTFLLCELVRSFFIVIPTRLWVQWHWCCQFTDLYVFLLSHDLAVRGPIRGWTVLNLNILCDDVWIWTWCLKSSHTREFLQYKSGKILKLIPSVFSNYLHTSCPQTCTQQTEGTSMWELSSIGMVDQGALRSASCLDVLRVLQRRGDIRK